MFGNASTVDRGAFSGFQRKGNHKNQEVVQDTVGPYNTQEHRVCSEKKEIEKIQSRKRTSLM